jgi:cardiolipin synthase (CMP-forming)
MAASAFNLANLLTVLRFCAVPVVIVAIANQLWTLAFWLFVAAGVTDAIDGYLARHHGMATEVGAYLDPLADKALLVSIYVTLALNGIMPSWVAALVVTRDVMIIGAVIISWIMDNPVEINPLRLSKANTLAQIALVALVLGGLAFSIEFGSLVLAAIALVTALTLASMAAYLATWFRHMAS